MRPKSKRENEFLSSYDDYADAIFRYCFFKVSDYDLARDLTQETYLKTWQEVVRGLVIENHRAYLYRIATNLIIDHYRKKKTTSLDRLQEEGFDPHDIRNENFLEDSSEVKILKEAVLKLDEKYRDALLLRYIDEFSPKEIANILELSENVVSVRIHRGLKQLQKKMESE